MSHQRHCGFRLAFIALLSVPLSTHLAAQSVDSLTVQLGSADLRTRSVAISALAHVPLTSIPSSTRTALMGLLEREANGTQVPDPLTADPADEAWDEYIIELTDLVRRVGDIGALRGLSMLGIETSRAAQQFVAGFGAQALAPLDQAWAVKPNARPSVITVWALLALHADTATQAIALNRLLAATDTFPIALADAAVVGNLTALVPFLDSLAVSPTLLPIVQGALTEAANALRPQYASLAPGQLLGQYNTWLGAICLNASGPLQGYCESSTNGIDNSTKHLLDDSGKQLQQGFASQARQELQQVVDRTLDAVSNGVLSAWQGIVLVSGLRQAIARIPG